LKNTIKVFGIIAIVAVIVFSMTGCEEPDDNTTLTFKVTGIPSEHEGKYAGYYRSIYSYLNYYGGDGFDPSTGILALSRISNGSVTLTIQSYNRNLGKFEEWSIDIYPKEFFLSVFDEDVFDKDFFDDNNYESPRKCFVWYRNANFKNGIAEETWSWGVLFTLKD